MKREDMIAATWLLGLFIVFLFLLWKCTSL